VLLCVMRAALTHSLTHWHRVEIVDVVCGSDFSALLTSKLSLSPPTTTSAGWLTDEWFTEEGRVLACGANHFGQLGVGDVDPRTTPAEVRMPADFRVVQVALGGSHMLLLTGPCAALYLSALFFSVCSIGEPRCRSWRSVQLWLGPEWQIGPRKPGRPRHTHAGCGIARRKNTDGSNRWRA
jgi:hypothetical protein